MIPRTIQPWSAGQLSATGSHPLLPTNPTFSVKSNVRFLAGSLTLVRVKRGHSPLLASSPKESLRRRYERSEFGRPDSFCQDSPHDGVVGPSGQDQKPPSTVRQPPPPRLHRFGAEAATSRSASQVVPHGEGVVDPGVGGADFWVNAWDLKPCCCRSRRRIGRWEFSTRLFSRSRVG